VSGEPALIGFDQLNQQERAACLLAVRVLDVAVAEAWDVRGRRRAVDAMLTLTDGRKAAFEVTNLGNQSALEIARLLANDKHKWEAAGQWYWEIEVASESDRRRLRKCYKKIIRICEGAGVASPEHLNWSADTADPDVLWLIQSRSSMFGYPAIPVKNMQNPGVTVLPVSDGGVVDSSLSRFAEELAAAFETQHISEHFEKLRDADADERHLFIPLHESALPFSSFTVLQFEDALPAQPPRIPDYITHLWLAPASSKRVLIWEEGDGWRNFWREPDRPEERPGRSG
jgi:hypothetical protein